MCILFISTEFKLHHLCPTHHISPSLSQTGWLFFFSIVMHTYAHINTEMQPVVVLWFFFKMYKLFAFYYYHFNKMCNFAYFAFSGQRP